jgi:hypothetical protein
MKYLFDNNKNMPIVTLTTLFMKKRDKRPRIKAYGE